MSNESPKVFISYSWDSENHKNWVRKLATDLQRNGVHVFLDQWDTFPGEDIPNYMETCIRESDYVLLVCTPNFQNKANIGMGGIGYEKNIVTGEIWGGTTKRKYIPILRGDPNTSLPSYLKSKIYVDFRNHEKYSDKIEQVLRHIYKSPKYLRPDLGDKPDFSNQSIIDEEKVYVNDKKVNNSTQSSSRFDLNKFKEVYNFAYDGDTLNYTAEDAQEWANDFLKRFGYSKFNDFKDAFSFAYDGDTLDYTAEDAVEWAKELIVDQKLKDLNHFKDAFSFAYDGDTLDYTAEDAQEWAKDFLNQFGYSKFKEFKDIFSFAYDEDTLDYTAEDAQEWAKDFLNQFGYSKFNDFKKAFYFAYDEDTLDYTAEDAVEWAFDKIK